MKIWSVCLFVFGVCLALAEGCAADVREDPADASAEAGDGAPVDVEAKESALTLCPHRRSNVQEFAMWVVGSPYTGDYTCYNTSPNVWFCRSPNWPDYVRLYYPPQVAQSWSNPCPRLIADFIECSDSIGGCFGATGRISCTGYTTNAYNECR